MLQSLYLQFVYTSLYLQFVYTKVFCDQKSVNNFLDTEYYHISIVIHLVIYVTGFVKRSLPHTSNSMNLKPIT